MVYLLQSLCTCLFFFGGGLEVPEGLNLTSLSDFIDSQEELEPTPCDRNGLACASACQQYI